MMSSSSSSIASTLRHQSILHIPQRLDHLPVLVELDQTESLDLAAGRARDLLGEDHPAVQCLVAGKLAARKGVDFFCGGERGACLEEHDVGAGDFGDVVFEFVAGDGRVFDGGVLQQYGFQFGWCDLPSVVSLLIKFRSL